MDFMGVNVPAHAQNTAKMNRVTSTQGSALKVCDYDHTYDNDNVNDDAGHDDTVLVMLMFVDIFPAKLTLKMIINFSKLYTKLKTKTYLTVSCKRINHYVQHHRLRDL